MASPFSMLSMLSRRRQAAKRTESTTSITNESSTATLATPSSTSTSAASAAATLINSTPKRKDSMSSISGIASSPPKATISPPAATKDTSDTASIRSVSVSPNASATGTLRKATLLSRFSSGAVETLTSALGGGAVTPAAAAGSTPNASRPSTPAPAPAATLNAEALRPPTPAAGGSVLSDSPKMQTADLRSLSSDEGFFDGGSDTGKDVPATASAIQGARRESSGSTSLSSVLEKKSLEAVIVQNAVDKQMIKKLEDEKAALEKEKAALLEEKKREAETQVQLVEGKNKVWQEKEDLAKEKANLEEAKSALERENLSLAKLKAELEKEKEALSQENERLLKEMRDREALWDEARRVQASSVSSLEAKITELNNNMQEKEASWESERGTLQATFEAEKNWLEGEIKQMVTEWEIEKEKDRKDREQELALVERDNDSLTSRVAELEGMLNDMTEAKASLENDVVELQQEKIETIALIDALKNDVSLAMEDIEKLQRDEEVQKRREEVLLKEMERLRSDRDADVAVRDSRIDILTATLKETRSQYEDLHKLSENKLLEKGRTIEDLEEKMSAYYKYVDQTDQRNRILCDQLKRQSMEIRFATPTESKKLLRTSGQSIESAVRLLNAFNSEAFQAAASFADSVESETFLDFSGVAELEPLAEKLAPVMSREMVRALRASYTNSIQDPDTLLLQIAFQACVTYCANRFISSWYPFEWDHGDFLQILHSRILDTGKKDIAASWRSTTKSLLSLTSESHPQMLAYLREYVYDILAVVGRSRDQPAVESLVKRYEEKFSIIARLAIRLHMLVFDESSDLGSYAALPESEFVHDHQEDNYAEGGSQSDTDLLSDLRVLCTTELGLQKLAAAGEDTRLVLLKPKVALSTILSADW